MSANEKFFDAPRPQAVFKHAILSKYPVAFASKVGSRWPVVFLDGYAGRGEYGDGTPGSPARLIRAADRFGSSRNIRGIFVERNDEDHAHLQAVVGRHGRPDDTVLHGDVREHLPAIMKLAESAALFAFLDPFGTALDRSQLVESLLKRHRRQPPVEVLLHFSVGTVARLGGLLRKGLAGEGGLSEADAKSIEHVDRFLGGTWWQEHFQPVQDGAEEQATTAALRVAALYQRDICARTGFRAVSLPIRRRPAQQPKYVLVLFTKHRDGLWLFASTLGRAGLDWQRAWHTEVDNSKLATAKRKNPEEGLFGLEVVLPPEPFDDKKYEEQQKAEWQHTIAGNIEHLLAAAGGGPLVLADQVDDVYGTVLGAAWEKHVRAAVKALYVAGRIDHNGVGHFYKEPIRLLPGQRAVAI